MKVSITQYAQILNEAVVDGRDSNIKDKIRNYVQILIINNDISKIDKIIESYDKLWNKEHGIVEAEVVSAKKLDNEIIKLLNGYVSKLSGAKRVILNNEVNKDILGGVVIKYGDKVLDGSLKASLLELKSRMIK
ncbi:MAG: ATP synthase F1 subunit delta [Patescibacteria group bacterium]